MARGAGGVEPAPLLHPPHARDRRRLVVALATALEGFFRHGDRWRNYRRTTEALKSQGWQFFQLAGPYAAFADHSAAHATFAADVEAIINHDVETYFTRIAVEQKPGGAGEDGSGHERG